MVKARVAVYEDRINVSLPNEEVNRVGGRFALFNYSNKKGQVEVQLVPSPDGNPGTLIRGKQTWRRIQFTQHGLQPVKSFEAIVTVEHGRLVLRNRPAPTKRIEPLEKVFA